MTQKEKQLLKISQERKRLTLLTIAQKNLKNCGNSIVRKMLAEHAIKCYSK